jgi:hypothetical protein
MANLILIKIGWGNFEEGFEVILQSWEEGKALSREIHGKLPPYPAIYASYQSWLSNYLQHGECLRRATKGNSKSVNPKLLLEQCSQSSVELINHFENWLTSEDRAWRDFRENLRLELGNEKTANRVIIQTEHSILKKLPWHKGDLFANISSDIALYPLAFKKPDNVVTTDKSAVNILAIFGNSEGINLDEDEEFVKGLKSEGANIVTLKEPTKSEFSNSIWENKYDILFFAGHSSSQGGKGQIFINSTETLTIEELKSGLKKAIQNGLQLAIFNSCDGLKLAEDLAKLNIPQVIVMREPVLDIVAQDFLKLFLNAFAVNREPLDLSVRHARERLHENGWDEKSPGASWLPVLYQNPTMMPLTWEELKGKINPKPIKDKNPKLIKKLFKTVLVILLIIILSIITVKYSVKSSSDPEKPHPTMVTKIIEWLKNPDPKNVPLKKENLPPKKQPEEERLGIKITTDIKNQN